MASRLAKTEEDLGLYNILGKGNGVDCTNAHGFLLGEAEQFMG